MYRAHLQFRKRSAVSEIPCFWKFLTNTMILETYQDSGPRRDTRCRRQCCQRVCKCGPWQHRAQWEWECAQDRGWRSPGPWRARHRHHSAAPGNDTTKLDNQGTRLRNCPLALAHQARASQGPLQRVFELKRAKNNMNTVLNNVWHRLLPWQHQNKVVSASHECLAVPFSKQRRNTFEERLRTDLQKISRAE